MKPTAKLRAFLFGSSLLATFGSPVSHAAPITWGTATTISGVTNVLNAGASNYGYNWNTNSQTVNGVTFTGTTSLTAGGTDITLSGFTGANNGNGGITGSGNYGSGSGTFNGLTAAYKGMLAGSNFTNAATAVTVTLNNLTSGHVFATQVWVDDSRSGFLSRNATVTSSGGNAVLLNYTSSNSAGGVGQFTIGRFTADATTQAFTITGNASTQLNAIQARDVTNIGNWVGTGGATWDAATTNNFASNLYSAALTTTTSGTASALLSSVTFADTYWSSGATTAVTQNTVTIASAGVSTGTVNFDNSAINYTINNASGAVGIAGTTAISKNGSGTVTFSSPNTFTGATTITGGTLQISGNGTLGAATYAGAITISSGTLLQYSSSANQALTGAITGAGGITKDTNTSDLTLSTGSKTYSGATTISAGRINVANAAQLSPNTAVTVTGNSIVGGQLYVQGSGTMANNFTISGVGFSDTVGAFVVNGGAIRLNGSNVLSGTISLAADSRIGTITGSVSNTISGKITGSAGVDFYAAFVANTNSSTFTLSNVGTANDYTGNTQISAVDYSSARTGNSTILTLGASDQLPNGTGKGNLVFNGADADHLTVFELNGKSETINGLSNTAAAGARIRNTATGASVLTIGDNNTVGSFSGTIADGGVGKTLAITKIGSNTLTLSGTNSYTGGVTINAGTVQLGSTGALYGTPSLENAVTFGASSTGTLALSSNSVVIANLTTNATPGSTFVQNANGSAVGNATLTVGNSTNASGTFAGTLRDGSGGGTLALTKAGGGTLTLSGSNTYTGATSVGAGTLTLSGGLADTAITVSGTAVLSEGSVGVISGASSLTHTSSGISTLAGTNTYSGATTVSAGTLRVDGVIAGSGTSLASGATLTGSGTVNNTVTVDNGTGAITAGNGTTGTLSIANLTFNGTGVINVGTLSNYLGAAAVDTIGVLTPNGGPAAVTFNLPTTAVASNTYHLLHFGSGIADASGFTLGTVPALSSRQVGALQYDGTNNFLNYVITGASTIWSGAGTPSSEWSTNIIGGSKNWTVSGAPTDFLASDLVIFDDTATTRTVDISSGDVSPVSVTFANSTGDYTVQGSNGIAGVGGLTKTGSSALIISTFNTYTGATALSAGILRATTNANALGLGALTLAGGELQLANDTDLNFGSNTTVTGNVQLTSDTLTAVAGVTHTLGTLSIGAQTLGIAKGSNATGTTAGVTFGAASLNGAPTFSIGTDSTLSLTAVTNAGNTITLTGAGKFAQTGNLTGAGGLTLNSGFSGIATLSSTGTNYSGATTISGGTLVLAHTTLTPAFSSAVTVNAGTTLQFTPTTSTAIGAAATVALNGTLTFNPATSVYQGLNGAVTVGSASIINITPGATGTNFVALYFDGALNGSAALTVNGSTSFGGTALVLRSTTSNYSGALTVNGTPSADGTIGTGLALGPVGTTLGSADLTINGTLDIGHRGLSTGGMAAFTNAVNNSSLSIDALSGSGVVASNGITRTLSVGNNNEATATFSGTLANGTAASSVLAFTKAGSGTQILSGTNTYTGLTTASSGTLKNGSATTFGSAGIGNGALALSGTGIFDLNGFNAAVTTVSASATGSTITNNGANDATLAISTQANTISSLVTDGTKKIAVTVRNDNGAATPFLLTKANTFSGGLTLLDSSPLSANGTRFVIGAAITTVGSPGAITSSPFGTGTITIGQTATDKAGIYFNTTANITLVNAVTINTSLGNDRYGIRSDVAGVVMSGIVTANADAVFSSNINSNPAISLTNKVTGAGGLAIDLSQTSVTTSMTVTLNNATGNPNDYAGNTVIGRTNSTPTQNYTATLSLGAANQIPNGTGKGNVTLNNDSATRTGTLKLNGFSETINGLSGNGTVDGVSGTPTLTVGDNDAISSFSGIIKNTAGALALTKVGAGTLTLTGANTYSGGTSVTAGTVTLGNATALGTAAASVSGGSLDLGGQTITNAVSTGASGTLTGSGITGAATIAGSMTPGGSSSGLITMASASVASTSAITLQLAAIGTNTRGVDYDAITVSGPLALDGTVTVSLNGLTPASGQFFNVVDSTGSIDLTNFNIATDLILPALGGGLAWDTSAFASTGVISIVNGDPYIAWAALNGATGGKAGDTDNDGRNNLLEFATDGNPTSGANDGKIVTKIATVAGDQVLTLTLPVRLGATFTPSLGDQVSALVDALYYRIEGDVDLATFADSITEVPAGLERDAIQAGLPGLSSGSWTYRTFRAPGTVPTVPKAFLRAKISDTP